MLLVIKAHEYSKKKILFITSTEQNALKYKNDLLKIFEVEAEILPFQNISMYETINSNKYDYAEQVKILRGNPDIVITPVKTLLEKFPTAKFYDENLIKIKVGDEIDLKEFAKKLVNLGYKKATMVTDIQEFSIRGDIIDVYSLSNYPVRIELWGDEVVDIRYFNNETQKSVEKVNETEILPMYKFIAPQNTNFSDEEGYFEGIEVYQSFFNENLVSALDYFKDYTIITDETSEILAKYEFLDNSAQEKLEEKIKLELVKELKDSNHIKFADFQKQMARFMRIGLDNFVDSENRELVEFDTEAVRSFAADLDEIALFIDEHT